MSFAARLVLVVALAVVMLGGLWASLKADVHANPPAGTSPSLSISGRYQFTTQGSQEFIFDTQTGKL